MLELRSAGYIEINGLNNAKDLEPHLTDSFSSRWQNFHFLCFPCVVLINAVELFCLVAGDWRIFCKSSLHVHWQGLYAFL